MFREVADLDIRSSPVRGLARLRSYDRIFLPSWLSDITDTLPEIKSFLQVDFVVETDHIGISFRGPETCHFRHHFCVPNTVPDTNSIRRSIGRAETISIRYNIRQHPETISIGRPEIGSEPISGRLKTIVSG